MLAFALSHKCFLKVMHACHELQCDSAFDFAFAFAFAIALKRLVEMSCVKFPCSACFIFENRIYMIINFCCVMLLRDIFFPALMLC